jgi:hypothetical protein
MEFHHLGGGIVVNTPVSGWADNYLATHNDRMSWKCSEDAKNHYQSIISSNPDFPFPYYFLAFCLNQQKDESWIEYAQKGVNILQHTTIVPEHDPSHDDVLNRLNGLFRHRND